MKCTSYFEENEIVDYGKYEKALEKLCVSENITRDIKVRKAVFRSNVHSKQSDERVVFSICMKNFSLSELYLEKKTLENGMVFKSFTKISKKEADKILSGDYQWLKNNRKALLQDFCLECEINQLKLVCINDTVKDVCEEVRGLDGIVFKHSMRSTAIEEYSNQFFDRSLPMSDVFNCDKVLYSYRRYVHIPSAVSNILHLHSTTKNSVAYSL